MRIYTNKHRALTVVKHMATLNAEYLADVSALCCVLPQMQLLCPAHLQACLAQS